MNLQPSATAAAAVLTLLIFFFVGSLEIQQVQPLAAETRRGPAKPGWNPVSRGEPGGLTTVT